MKYLKTYEAIVFRLLSEKEVKSLYTPIINWDLINDAKDMSLEYLDEGMSFHVQIIDTCEKVWLWASPNRSFSYVYSINFNHDECEENWFKVETGDIKLKYCISLYTNIRFCIKRYDEESKELLIRLKEAYPNENIEVFGLDLREKN